MVNKPLETVQKAIKAIDPDTHTETEIPKSLGNFLRENAEALQKDKATAGVFNKMQEKMTKASTVKKPGQDGEMIHWIQSPIRFSVSSHGPAI